MDDAADIFSRESDTAAGRSDLRLGTKPQQCV